MATVSCPVVIVLNSWAALQLDELLEALDDDPHATKPDIMNTADNDPTIAFFRFLMLLLI